jgi:hypothetical protein
MEREKQGTRKKISSLGIMDKKDLPFSLPTQSYGYKSVDEVICVSRRATLVTESAMGVSLRNLLMYDLN